MKKHNAKQLFRKYQQGEASAEEQLLVEQLFQKDLESSEYRPDEERILKASERIKTRLMEHIGQESPVKTIRLWPGIAVSLAAAIALIVCGIYFFNPDTPAESTLQAGLPAKKGLAGFKKATLILGDGRAVELGAEQTIKNSDGVQIFADESSALVYKTGQNAGQLPAYNSLVVPKGGEYKLVLADGTEVWLNADTKIRYQVNFDATKTRTVFLERGEAYFKVAKNPEKPFIVHHGDMEVQVLGTSFNVNAYSDDIQTTLAEGKVKVSLNNAKAHLELAPGQQANFNIPAGTLEKQEVDIYPFVAWKDGILAFENVTMEMLMAQIGRLYDYDIQFRDESLKQLHYSGSTDKPADLRKILNIIQKTSKLKLTIKERTIIVEKSTKK